MYKAASCFSSLQALAYSIPEFMSPIHFLKYQSFTFFCCHLEDKLPSYFWFSTIKVSKQMVAKHMPSCITTLFSCLAKGETVSPITQLSLLPSPFPSWKRTFRIFGTLSLVKGDPFVTLHIFMRGWNILVGYCDIVGRILEIIRKRCCIGKDASRGRWFLVYFYLNALLLGTCT